MKLMQLIINLEIEYYSHLCACGCDGRIQIRKRHSWAGIPKYISGHNSKGKQHHMYGKHHTEEALKKQSESHKGLQTWNKGLTNELDERVKNNSEKRKGKKRTEKQRKNISKGKKGKSIKITDERRKELSESFIGENNPNFGKFGEESTNWNGGTSFLPYSPKFNKKLKKQILERDNYECQDPNCEHKISKLDVHHIDFNKQNSNQENLIILCKSCHSKTIGKNRQYWIEYYQNIMKDRF